MMATSSSETSVDFYPTTRRNNPEDSHLQVFSFGQCGIGYGFSETVRASIIRDRCDQFGIAFTVKT
jgi:hypothetical protein